jgi:fimbrial chaperone protein
MLKVHSRAAALAGALFLCVLAAAPVREARAAAQFSVSPLLLNLPAEKLATSLTLGNDGGKPVTVQTELVGWNQDSGEDAYAEAAGVVVSPPIFSLAAGAKQVVRIGRLKRTAPPPRELAYRIKLTEVPAQASEQSQAVTTFMQLSLPMFVPPADKKAKAAVEFKGAMQPNRDVHLSIANPGLIHDKITRLILLQDGKSVAEQALSFYVLSGARRELAWPGALKNAKPGPVELKVQLEGRNRFLSQILAPEAPPAPAPAPEAGKKD